MRSLGIFVGAGRCNARCAHCGGLQLRKFQPHEDGEIDARRILDAVKRCRGRGATSLSLTSGGEPTLSPLAVTRVLGLLYSHAQHFERINLYTNGILLANKKYVDTYLAFWQKIGLTHIQLTVHDVSPARNASVYGCARYPSLSTIVSNTHLCGLKIRANLLIGTNNIATLKQLKQNVTALWEYGFDEISMWLIRNREDKIDQATIPAEYRAMCEWARNNNVRDANRAAESEYRTGEKLTLFPDGTLSDTWCRS